MVARGKILGQFVVTSVYLFVVWSVFGCQSTSNSEQVDVPSVEVEAFSFTKESEHLKVGVR